jgi:hypothetical protein
MAAPHEKGRDEIAPRSGYAKPSFTCIFYSM